jgi:uncharacterized protein (TIGR02466 family)
LINFDAHLKEMKNRYDIAKNAISIITRIENLFTSTPSIFKMQKLNLFPTAIGLNMDLPMAEKILPYAKGYLNNSENLTNTWNYKTTYKSSNIMFDDDFFFCQYLIKFGNEYLNSLGYKSLDLRPQIFFSEMNISDYHTTHNHPSSILSGVMYLTVPQGSSEIRFYDPRPHKNYINLPIQNDCEYNWDWYKIQPKEGLILIWESWLSHEVLKNNCDGRITAVFNLLG